jgi:hypothetical protein
MPYQLGYSIIEEFNNNDKNEKTHASSIESKKKTRKNRNTMVNKKVESFLASIGVDNDSENENEAFSKFENDHDNHLKKFNNNPYVNPVSVYNEKQNELEKQQTIQSNEDSAVTNEQFQTFQNQSQEQYYNSYIPYTTNASNSQSSDNQGMLIEKLNYMIHLLEEQQEEKTGHVTEELILYTFLGVFVIFVIDSFARASKYVR